ncbi:MAG: pyrrolo-quinoline quinone repeat-containing protein [Candidatus Berkelbacteria bacterium Athens1014_28]|uniref:Pyrrolo-quinoline quinone repeat-containing protein n=1 Tax=Candidatus Berkelbacteria bacterium Athens1014_28 TaxID=2017145 RepID=A0A554LN65_9BACT|nr:MAG: pyrrolo-quinoline quinone repeat-containing protein [Candidatus Berkelbacteria bacterium Athens1014_28]
MNKRFLFGFFVCFLLAAGISIQAVSAASSGLADSSWPVFGHDARHTNVSPYEVGKEKKELLWSYKAESGIESSPAIGADGTIYVGSHDGYFYAFNKDGSLKWKVKLTEPSFDERWNNSKAIMASPAIAKDGTIYINTASDFLHALNPDGSEKWRFSINWHNDFWNGPNIGSDGTIYIGTARFDGASENSGLYAISPDGTRKWFVQESSGISIVPTVMDDGTVIYGAADPKDNKGKIIAATPDGKKKWEFMLEEWLEGSAAIGPDGTIFSGSKEGNVYALNPDGSEKWRFKTEGGISATPTIGSDGNIYIGSWDGNFYALDQKTAEEKWRFDAKLGRDPKLFEGYPGKETIITNAALSKDGVLIFADVFDTLYALDTAGKELWRWKNTSGAGFASSPAVNSDGTIYFGDEGGNFYALSEKGSDSNANIASDTPSKGEKPLPFALIYQSAAILSILISAGTIYILRRRKQLSRKILLAVLSATLIIVVSCGVLLFFNKFNNDSKSSILNLNSNDKVGVTSTQKSDTPKDDDSDFVKNSTRVSDTIDVRVREFGETGRSCAGKGCGSLKDTCVRWNKTRDQCYETARTSPATSDKYLIYCNMVVVNQDEAKAAQITLNLNYTTADGVKHLVKKESLNLKPQTGNSLGWTYDVAAENIGKCGYSDILVEESNN